eukprot:1178639-Prorocentrum_minimum.AAC.4
MSVATLSTGLQVWGWVRMFGHGAAGVGVCAHVQARCCWCGGECTGRAQVGSGIYIIYTIYLYHETYNQTNQYAKTNTLKADVQVSTFRPTAPSNQRSQAWRPVGSAILARQKARWREYGDGRPRRLQVFAPADYGILLPDARALLREGAAVLEDHPDVEGRLST